MYYSPAPDVLCDKGMPEDAAKKYLDLLDTFVVKCKPVLFNWKKVYMKHRDNLDDLAACFPAPEVIPFAKQPIQVQKLLGESSYNFMVSKYEYITYPVFKKTLEATFDKFLNTVTPSTRYVVDYKTHFKKSGFWIFMLLIKHVETHYPKLKKQFMETVMFKSLRCPKAYRDVGLKGLWTRFFDKTHTHLVCDDASYSGQQLSIELRNAMPCIRKVVCVVPYATAHARARLIQGVELFTTTRMRTLFGPKYTIRDYIKDGGKWVHFRDKPKKNATANANKNAKKNLRKVLPSIFFAATQDLAVFGYMWQNADSLSSSLFQHKTADNVSLPTIISPYSRKYCKKIQFSEFSILNMKITDFPLKMRNMPLRGVNIPKEKLPRLTTPLKGSLKYLSFFKEKDLLNLEQAKVPKYKLLEKIGK